MNHLPTDLAETLRTAGEDILSAMRAFNYADWRRGCFIDVLQAMTKAENRLALAKDMIRWKMQEVEATRPLPLFAHEAEAAFPP